MKKTICIAVVALLLVPTFVFSQEKSEEAATMEKDTVMQEAMTKPAAKEEMHKRHAKMGMMGMMMKTQMAVTPDGGVIVLCGNKLLKYDKDLNLLKETEIKMDLEGMGKMMGGMKEKCPMSKQMMQEEGSEPVKEEKKD